MNTIPWKEPQKKKDIILLERILTFCQFVKVLPFNGYSRNKLRWCLEYMMWIIFHVIGFYFMKIQNSSNFVNTYNVSSIGLFLNIMDLLSTITYFAICVTGVLQYHKNVQQIIINLQHIDNALGKKLSNEIKKFKMFLNIFLLHMIPLLVVSNKILNHIGFSKNKLYYYFLFVYTTIITYMQFLPALVIYILKNIVTIRYQHFKIYIKDSMINLNGLKNRNLNRTTSKLRQTYFLFNDCLKQIDQIFGYPILLIFISSCISFLQTFDKIIVSFQNDNGSFMKIIYLFTSCMVSIKSA